MSEEREKALAPLRELFAGPTARITYRYDDDGDYVVVLPLPPCVEVPLADLRDAFEAAGH